MSYYILTSVQNLKIHENISFLLLNQNVDDDKKVNSYVSHSLFDFLSFIISVPLKAVLIASKILSPVLPKVK